MTPEEIAADKAETAGPCYIGASLSKKLQELFVAAHYSFYELNSSINFRVSYSEFMFEEGYRARDAELAALQAENYKLIEMKINLAATTYKTQRRNDELEIEVRLLKDVIKESARASLAKESRSND